MTGRPLICFSLTREQHERLARGGPRRDIPLLAERLGGELLFRTSASKKAGLRGKFAGPHLRHAWAAARKSGGRSVVFADGEHVGIPLSAFLAIHRRRSTRLVMLGHYVDKPWKRGLLWAASRLVPSGSLILHSKSQAKGVGRFLGRGWDVQLLPYQVDTEFWSRERVPTSRPLVVAAGSENRDYLTLIEAVRGLDLDLQIASGSHWARTQATAGELPGNVEFLTETLSFAGLRELYAKASVVVVPLHPVNNQSGITTILEAMSMAKPLIVTATPGQRETVLGPLVRASEEPVMDSTRGPHVFGLQPGTEPSGLYVLPGDPAGLRRAITMIVDDVVRAESLAVSARATATRLFSVETFAERFAEVIREDPGEGLPLPELVSLP